MVADKLKLGQTVEPEAFDSVTIFLSDVVSFTKLASRCSPLQVAFLFMNQISSYFPFRLSISSMTSTRCLMASSMIIMSTR